MTDFVWRCHARPTMHVVYRSSNPTAFICLSLSLCVCVYVFASSFLCLSLHYTCVCSLLLNSLVGRLRVTAALWNSANQNPFAICRIKTAIASANYERICKVLFSVKYWWWSSGNSWFFYIVWLSILCSLACALTWVGLSVLESKIKMSWLQSLKFIELSSKLLIWLILEHHQLCWIRFELAEWI